MTGSACHSLTRACASAQRLITVLSLLAAVLAFAVPAGAAVSVPTGNPLPGSTFQAGDGDQNSAAPLVDWQDYANQGSVNSADDPNAADSTFSTGSHENDPLHWETDTQAGGVTPSKSNLLATWNLVDGDQFLYLAFTREKEGGNVFLAFELNQDARQWRNASGSDIACRTTGDLILSYEIQGTGNVDVKLQKWVSDSVVSADEAATYTNGEGCAKSGEFENFEPSSDIAQGAISQNAITNYLPLSPTVSEFGAGLFGEAGLNLTELLGAVTSDGCYSFGKLSMHSRSSSTSSASLQDVLGPIDVGIHLCNPGGGGGAGGGAGGGGSGTGGGDNGGGSGTGGGDSGSGVQPEPGPSNTDPGPATGTQSSAPPPAAPAAVTPQPIAKKKPLPIGGTANMSGPNGCVQSTFAVSLSGKNIKKASFYLDRKLVKRSQIHRISKVRSSSGLVRYRIELKSEGLKVGLHRVTAKVRYLDGSIAKKKLQLAFHQCKAHSLRFAG